MTVQARDVTAAIVAALGKPLTPERRAELHILAFVWPIVGDIDEQRVALRAQRKARTALGIKAK
jgi:hypothetical protein